MSQFLKRKYRKDVSLMSKVNCANVRDNKRNFVTIFFFFRTKLQKNHRFFKKKKNCYISIAHPLLVSKVHKDELILPYSIIILNWNFEGKYYTLSALHISINFDHHNFVQGLLYILFLDSVKQIPLRININNYDKFWSTGIYIYIYNLLFSIWW